MASQIETLVETQHRLLADISHELRSPLTRLRLALAIARRKSSEEIKAPLDRIEREAVRLDGLIQQLLTLVRLESGSKRVRHEEFDLAMLLREIVSDAQFEAQGSNRRVGLVCPEECKVRGNRELLRSAIENVVRNAVNYTAEGTEVVVEVDSQEGQLAILVSDHGPGVPVEVLQHIFDPFFRVDEARERSSGGAGLGLAITQQVIQHHGGTVTALNAAEGGLRMVIELPS
jgi:two-component system sensor histidine kinase CpxA